MGGWVDGWMDGCTDGRTAGWMDANRQEELAVYRRTPLSSVPLYQTSGAVDLLGPVWQLSEILAIFPPHLHSEKLLLH